MNFLYCVCYLALLGIAFFFIGRAMARHSFNTEGFPFKCAKFERGGLIYKKLGVHKWQKKVPDMSRICKAFMPEKKLSSRPDRKSMGIMINETCVAELVHLLLPLFALPVLWILPGWGGWLVWIVYTLGNVPDILIQRYNRPRLIKLYRHLKD